MKDSKGNDLPERIFLHAYSSEQDRSRASTINTFLTSVSSSLNNGSEVVYDEYTRTARIIHKDGSMNIINHS